jgi:predicted AlkP superfamily phosphohydrolase/phosphomutase
MGHVGQVYVNLQGREPHGVVAPGEAYEAARREIEQVLQQLRDPETGARLPVQIIRGEDYCQGPFAAQGPDLHVVLDEYRAIAFPLFATDGQVVTRQIRGDSGCHRRDGLLVACGPGIAAGQAVAGAQIVDLAPTILQLFGVPIPPDFDGRVLPELVGAAAPARYQSGPQYAEAPQDLSPEEEIEIQNRLRDLGYLG